MRSLSALESDFWRAPSAHNTQPWVLRYSDDAVEVGWDPGRVLPEGDPTGRDLRLSLGAFVECCLVVCAGAGLRVGFRVEEGPHRVGVLHRAGEPYDTPFTVEDVRRRASARGGYRPGRLDARLVEELAGYGGELRRVPCRELTGLLREADRDLFGDAPVTAELRHWLRLAPSHPRYRLDGLTDRALALSRAEALGLRAALSLLAHPLPRRAGLPRALAAASRGLLDHDGDVLVLVAPKDCGPAGQVTMGRVLMRQWLALSRHGHATHPLSQIIDRAGTRAALARLLGVDDPARLMNVARVGRPAGPPTRSARLR
ncbi:hypothetical protein FHS43_002135 [Streptosporangium becharense]|uniref:Nitroreductase n=1 Tax=Streptosporangium becharense TaxID=1816182 RepID=A0A7W9IBA2_9ACTN|nr:hypothetical protein [Streptosporangium becharense]MBB2910872.1 hypothetical protein [Streptosporangium becharense]MBB5817567.1 hypothetical protein [Streptosporangium becharense]